MKKYPFIILLIPILLIPDAMQAQSNDKVITLTAFTRLKSIPTCIGNVCTPAQMGSTTAPRNIHADEYFFENASIGKIEACKIKYVVQRDTVQSVTIYLSGQRSYEAARKQAQKQFGPSDFLQQGNKETFTWTTTGHHLPIDIILDRKNKEWGSTMVIQPQTR